LFMFKMCPIIIVAVRSPTWHVSKIIQVHMELSQIDLTHMMQKSHINKADLKRPMAYPFLYHRMDTAETYVCKVCKVAIPRNLVFRKSFAMREKERPKEETFCSVACIEKFKIDANPLRPEEKITAVRSSGSAFGSGPTAF
jgi:hypothetical protein